eukprot:gnl/TRDRNA2_/TRDRNA2_176968_c0_seq5.p1 gnl/TRDRNA2_/TRDRNA2_176968_c0~~gnl/TRDRNA2_/TRDRNA2_176968_c0_seq5.p1  ORF type:complete len:435 (-),score=67.37 gnl/TRDRNA2_/TRDRNA2_176968_c0_seq5:50-1354(-)
MAPKKPKAKAKKEASGSRSQTADTKNSRSAVPFIFHFIGIVALIAAVLFGCTKVGVLVGQSFDAKTAVKGHRKRPHTPCTEAELQQWLFVESKWSGYHVLCFDDVNSGEQLKLRYWLHGVQPPESLELPTPKISELRSVLQRALNLHRRSNQAFQQNDFNIFTTDGQVLDLDSEEAELPTGLVLLYKGGAFLWPGIEVGFKRTVQADGKPYVLETISLKPHIFKVEGFMVDKESDHAIARAAKIVKPSPVALMDKDKGKAASEFRTSSSGFLPTGNDEVFQGLERRIASLTRTTLDSHEPWQMLHYAPGQQYLPHTDYFAPEAYRTDQQMQAAINGGFRNRMITSFFYLNTCESGGHTRFPETLDGLKNYSHKHCTTGLKVQPRKNSLSIFFSMLPDGSLDKFSTHMGCPPGEGQEKWSMTRWIWNERSPYAQN